MNSICRNCSCYVSDWESHCSKCHVKVIRNLSDVADEISKSLQESAHAQLTAAQVQLQIANEQNTSTDAAYKKGYGFTFLEKYPYAFRGALDENGIIQNLNYQAPYLLDRLIQSYNQGVWSRLKHEINRDLIISNSKKEFEKQVYIAGEKNSYSFELIMDLTFPKNTQASTKYFKGNKAKLKSNGHYELESPFESPFENERLNHIYIYGLNEFIRTENTSSRIAKRKTDAIKNKVNIFLVNIYIFIFWILMYFVITSLWKYNAFISFMVFLFSAVGIHQTFDSFEINLKYGNSESAKATIYPIVGLLIFFVPYFCLDFYGNICYELSCLKDIYKTLINGF